MSSRPFLIDKAEATLRLFSDADPTRNAAIAVVNTLMPVIYSTKELLGVPEGSLLIDGNGVPFVLDTPHMTNVAAGTSASCSSVIKDRGPLTVVYMP